MAQTFAQESALDLQDSLDAEVEKFLLQKGSFSRVALLWIDLGALVRITNQRPTNL